MRKWSKNNYVFISEEKAPNDFKVVWQKTKRRTLNSSIRSNKIEKIYVYKNGLAYKKLANKKYTQKKNKTIHTKYKKNQKTKKKKN